MDAKNAPKPEQGGSSRTIAFYVVLAAVLYVLFQSFSLLSPILLSLLLILLITLAVNPVILRLRRWTGGRRRSTGLVLVGLLTVGGLSVWAAVGPMADAVSTLSDRLPNYWERLQRPLIKMEQKGEISGERLREEVSAEIARETSEAEATGETGKPGKSGDDGKEGEGAGERGEAGQASRTLELPLSSEAPDTVPIRPEEGPARNHDAQSEEDQLKREKGERSIRSTLGTMVESVVGEIDGVAHSTTEVFVVLLTVFFGVTFTLMNPRPIFAALFSVVPERHHVQALAIMARIAEFVPRWAGAMLLSMLTIGLLFFLLMWPIFGFADALVLGLIACLLSAVPFLGPILTLIPALLLAIGEGGMTPLWVLLAYSAVQALEGNVILPLIMSRGMKLHPLAVIFSMLLSVAAFGILGVLIAAPLVAIAGIFHDELYRKRYLPGATDEDLDRLARAALLDKGAD